MNGNDGRCELVIDWDSGEGALRLGAAFDKALARFRHDVLAD